MTDWSLVTLLENLHDDIQHRLEACRKVFGHPGTKGDASEGVWLELLQKYLPRRYQADKAFVVDSHGVFSDQIDVVVYDRQYSPFIFNYQDQIIVPAESVYAVFEAKQAVNAAMVAYAKKKVASVRCLHRTTLPIPHAGGTYPAKALPRIFGGVLSFESDWNPPLGESLLDQLHDDEKDKALDFGCVAAQGHFFWDTKAGSYQVHSGGKPATAFLFKLISELQFSGTVPMIDVQAYAQWLSR
jgi:hypothetical protein